MSWDRIRKRAVSLLEKNADRARQMKMTTMEATMVTAGPSQTDASDGDRHRYVEA